MVSETMKLSKKIGIDVVLILVVVEDGLRGL